MLASMSLPPRAIATVVAFLASLVFAGSAHAGPPRTPVWVGSALDGTWPGADGCAGARYPSANCSLPTAHHTFAWGGERFPGDFGIDQQSVSPGMAVSVFAAPQDPNLNNQIRAVVQDVQLACRSRRPADGGHTVTVAIYHGSTKIGTIAYVHVDPRVSRGQTINRWGAVIGTVGSYRSNGCWSGVHLHMELMSMTNYACFNKGWRPGQRMRRTNFVGYIGGAFASAPRRACP
jgi:hypothetical protein